MINLTATTHKLQVTTSSATTTHVVTSYRNKSSAGVESYQSNQAAITTATQTDVVPVPGASEQNVVDDVEICVTGSGTQGVTVVKDVSGTDFTLLNVLLGSSERAHYTNDMGWRVFDAFGREKGIPVGYSQLAPATVFNTAGAYTYNVPLGTTAVLIELWGGGGQGGGGATAASSAGVGAGGSAGGYVRKFLIGVSSTITGSAGAAGSGGAAGAAGTAGGNTTTTNLTTNLTATGGTGGTLGAAGTTVADTAAPAAVSGTNGDENITTESGGAAFRFSGTLALAGRGGISAVGNAGSVRCTQGTGNAATGNAAGGGGGATINGGATTAGGAGTPGYARFTPYTG